MPEKSEPTRVIVCHCRVVNDAAIDAALAEGARTVSAVCRSTGAAQDCGTCIFSVQAIVCRHREQERAMLAIDGEAS